MESLTGDVVDDVVDVLPLVESVEEAGEGPQIQCSRTHAEQMVLDSPQFHQNRSDHLAPWRQIDIEQRFTCIVPGDVVDDRADVVHPRNGADVLVVVMVLTELLEAAVEIPDVRGRPDNPLAIKLKHDPKGRMGCRVLRTEVQDPPVTRRRTILQIVQTIGIDVPCFGWLKLIWHREVGSEGQ